jgi:putative MFS transporter
MTLANTLDAAQLTRFRRRVTALSSCGMFLDGFDLTVIAVALPVLKKQWHIPSTTLGLVSASALIGMLLGALVFGRLTDRLGRKTVYTLDLIAFVVFALLTAVAQNLWQLILFRLLLGIAIGADYPISSSLTAEFAATRSRGRHMALMSMAYGAGAVVAYLMGIAFAGAGSSSWRWMLLVGAGLAVVVTIARKTIPESPRWLSSQGRGDEAAAIVRNLLGGASDVGQAESPRLEGHGFGELFSRRFLRFTIFVCVFYFCFAVAFYGVQLYTPTIVGELTGSSTQLAAVGSAMVSFVGILGMLVGSVLVEAWGRRPGVILGMCGQGALLALLAVLSHAPFASIVVMFAAGLFFANIGPGIMILLYPSELFPTALRGSAVGLSVGASRIGAILGVFVFPDLVDAWGLHHALWLFAGTALLGALVCVVLAPETRGRVLEDIAEDADAAPAPHAPVAPTSGP